MNLQTLQNIFDCFYQRTYIPFSIVKDDQLIFPEYSPLFHYRQDLQYLYINDEFPLQITNNYQFLGASFLYPINQETYRILIGPCFVLGSQIKDQYMKELTYRISSESTESFTSFCQNIYTLLTTHSLNENQIPIKYLRINHDKLTPKEIFEKNLYERRSEDATRDSYQFELRFLDYVKRGRKDKIDWIFKTIDKTYTVHLADNSLDTIKIKFISLVALLTRLAIDEGVPLDSAFSLSDSLIQNLPNMRSSQECLKYIKYASYEFIELIHHTSKQCSSLINQCIRYIDTHIYEKITLRDLEDTTGHSSVYISSRFTLELGLTFSQYLLNKKIEEAKHLLLFTDHSYQEISTLLNFTSQSHFTQRFKHVTGQTPKAYRDMNFKYL